MTNEAANLWHTRREPEYRYVHPKRLMMWLYIVSMVMIFAGLTSALVVSQADWKEATGQTTFGITVPSVFLYTTILVVLSSGTMQWAYWAAKRRAMGQVNAGLLLTMMLGIAFLFGQVLGFGQLVEQGVFLVDENPIGSFIYVITGMHALHLLGGLVMLVVFIVKGLRMRINPERPIGLELATTFWHSLGFLWLYLFVFLTYIYS